MKKSTTNLLIIAAVAVGGYLIYKKMKSGTSTTAKGSETEPEAETSKEPVLDAESHTETDGTTATAITTQSGQTAVTLPGGIKVSPEQVKKLKGKVKTAAVKALTKLKAKKALKKARKNKVSGFDNLPILF